LPDLSIPYVTDGDTPVRLLTEAERIRLNAQRADLEGQSAAYKKAGLPEEATALHIQAGKIADELKIDDEVRTHPEAKVAVIEYAAPTLEDLEAVRAVLPDGGKARQVAYERLAPKAVSGWDGDLPYRFYPVVSEACYGSIDFNPSEDRRFFLTRWRSGSS
jgi:hypothetical protein